jgi:hypothetical protein
MPDSSEEGLMDRLFIERRYKMLFWRLERQPAVFE